MEHETALVSVQEDIRQESVTNGLMEDVNSNLMLVLIDILRYNIQAEKMNKKEKDQ